MQEVDSLSVSRYCVKKHLNPLFSLSPRLQSPGPPRGGAVEPLLGLPVRWPLRLGWRWGHRSRCLSQRFSDNVTKHSFICSLSVQVQVSKAGQWAAELPRPFPPFSAPLVSVPWQDHVGLMSQMEVRRAGFDVSDLCISHLWRLMQNLGYWSQLGEPDLTGVWASASHVWPPFPNWQRVSSRWEKTEICTLEVDLGRVAPWWDVVIFHEAPRPDV